MHISTFRLVLVAFACAIVALAVPTKADCNDDVFVSHGKVVHVGGARPFVDIKPPEQPRVRVMVTATTVITLNGVPATLAQLQQTLQADRAMGITMKGATQYRIGGNAITITATSP